MIAIDETKLVEGIWKASDFMKLFNVANSTFNKNREQYFKILEEYYDCIIEQKGRGIYWLRRKDSLKDGGK